MAVNKTKEQFGSKFTTLGPVVHNPEILKQITRGGGSIAENLSEIVSQKVIIRAHGISGKKRAKLLNAGYQIIDSTCPFVTRLHDLASNYTKKGYLLIIIGSPLHPEIQALTEDYPNCLVINNTEGAQRLKPKEKIAIINQTTERPQKVAAIIKILKAKTSDLQFTNTICPDVIKRQNAAKNLALKVDFILVIGGQNSSNTDKLWQIVSQIRPAKKIASAKELKIKWLEDVKKIGIISGSSTPQSSIEEVIQKIKQLANELNDN
jgi:4-hydroxy-3-methylbut-2-enyl diphosphate reductase